VISKPDINKILIFSRGTVYITGKYYGEAEVGTNKKPFILPALFEQSLQKTINTLKKSGKKIYYVVENPEFPTLPNPCIPRLLRSTFKNCDIQLSTVKNRQQQYLDIIHRLKNVVIVETHDIFCPNGICHIFNEGNLLYAEYDHLSVAGSYFQAKKIIKKYLA